MSEPKFDDHSKYSDLLNENGRYDNIYNNFFTKIDEQVAAYGKPVLDKLYEENYSIIPLLVKFIKKQTGGTLIFADANTDLPELATINKRISQIRGKPSALLVVMDLSNMAKKYQKNMEIMMGIGALVTKVSKIIVKYDRPLGHKYYDKGKREAQRALIETSM